MSPPVLSPADPAARETDGGPGSLRSALRLGVLVLAPVVGVSALAGWLYFARAAVARWPGPKIAALPLDALARHATIPLVVVVLACAVLGSLLGLLARSLCVDRLRAALAMGVTGGVFMYLHVAAAYYVVRQITGMRSLAEAVAAPSVYLVASFIALGCAVFGQARRSGPMATTLAAAAVALVGLLDLVSSLRPGAPDDLMSIAPGAVLPLTKAVNLPVGILLLMISRGLAHRSRAAWRVAVALLVWSAVAHLSLVSSDYGYAALTVLVAAVLVSRRASFDARRDPRANVAVRGVVALLLSFAVALVAVLVNDVASNLPLGAGAMALDAARALAAQRLTTPSLRADGFATWFPWSVAASLALGVIYAVSPLFAPWRDRFSRSARDLEAAAALVRSHASDSLGPFILRRDKSFFFGPPSSTGEDGAVLAYRVVRGVALVSGGPIGPVSAREAAVERFVEFAHRRGWSVAFLGVAESDLPMLRSQGLVAVYHGDEAVVDVPKFSLSGGRMKAVRQAVGRLGRQGYELEVAFADDVGPELRREMVEVERQWLKGARKKGFVMELDDLFGLNGSDALFVIGRSPEGRVEGFLHLLVCPASRTLSLSSMPRRAGVPNGFNSWLIVRLVEWSAANGFETVSLNFSPLAELFSSTAALSTSQRIRRRALLGMKTVLSLQLDNLLHFNEQFCPRFVPRFIALESWRWFPRVVVAAMSVEGYLPFAGRLGGCETGDGPLGSEDAEVRAGGALRPALEAARRGDESESELPTQ